MDKNNLAGRKFLCVFDQRLPRSVRAELELFNLAADPLGRFVRIKCDLAARACVPEQAGRRFGIGVTDKEDRVLRVFDQSAAKNIGERFWNHHPAGENVNASRAQLRIPHRFVIQNERRDVPHELQARQLPAGHTRAAIIDIGHL